MAIRFQQILQDSINFVRNQPKTVLTFSLILFAAQLFAVFFTFSPDMMNVNSAANPTQLQQVEQILSPQSNLIFLMNQLLGIFISSWCLMTVHRINHHQHSTLANNFAVTLSRIFGMLALYILMLLPLIFGLTQGISATLSGQNISLVAIILLIAGIFVFIRLNLAPLHYLVQPVGVSQAAGQIWRAGAGRAGMLLLYTVVPKLILGVIVMQLSLVATALSPIFEFAVYLMAAFFSVCTDIFTYRFYSLFMPQPVTPPQGNQNETTT